jgi:hypothetical protein
VLEAGTRDSPNPRSDDDDDDYLHCLSSEPSISVSRISVNSSSSRDVTRYEISYRYQKLSYQY